MRIVVVTLALGLALHTQLLAQLRVEFLTEAVVVGGVSPGGTVALASIERHPGYFRAEITYRRELLSDSDFDGIVTLRSDREVPFFSVWAFVDIASGAYSVATPEADVMHLASFPFNDSFYDDGAGLVLVQDARTELELLYVRPRTGAWGYRTYDGGSSDRDGQSDERVRVRLGDLEPLGGGDTRLERILPGDVLVGVDRHKGEFFVVELDRFVSR